MVIFMERIYGEPGAAPTERRVRSWRRIDMTNFFPNHLRVVAEFHPIPNRTNIYTGKMYHYPFGGGNQGAPSIVSRFFARNCLVCREMTYCFIRHTLRLYNVRVLHCVRDDDNWHAYNPNAGQNMYFGLARFANHAMQVRFLSRNCHNCRVRHIRLVEKTRLDEDGNPIDHRHVCLGEPPNNGVVAESLYRCWQQLQNHFANAGGNQDHNADNQGRNHDQVAPDDGGAPNQNAVNQDGNQDQVAPDDGGAQDHNADNQDGNQDQVVPHNGGAHNHDAVNQDGNQDQVVPDYGGAHDHDADNQGGNQDQEASDDDGDQYH